MKKPYYFLIITLFLLPTIVGYLTNTDMHFSGLTYTTDGNTYLSFMNQAKEGKLLFTNMYTSEEVPSIMFRPTYLLAGWLSYATRLPNIVVYHLFRIIGIVLFVFLLEKLISLYFKDQKHRDLTLLLALFAAGIGFFFKFLTLFGIKQYGSTDLWVIDGNNFLILLSHPHTIFSLVLMLASVYFFLKWNKENNLKNIILSSIFAFILGFEHLFDVITLYLVISFFMLDQFVVKKKINWNKIKHLLIFGIITLIPFIYTYIIFTAFPSFASWNAQNVLESPKLLHVIFGYGIMYGSFILFLLHSFVKKNYNELKPEVKFIIYWIVAVLILIYSPFNIQRRFFEAVHIPFAIITGIFLFTVLRPYLADKFNKKIVTFVIFLIIALSLPTNLYHLFNQTYYAHNARGIFPYSMARYLYSEEVEALEWLSENAEKNAVILSTYNIGNYIPRYMNNKVYLGHWAQTIDFDIKSEEITDYFKENNGMQKIRGIKYVWYGIDEEMLNSNFMPNDSKIVFQNDKVSIFRMS